MEDQYIAYIVTCSPQSRCTFRFLDMFSKLKGLFSGPQVPAASGGNGVAPAPAPAPAPDPAKVRLFVFISSVSKGVGFLCDALTSSQ